MLFTWYVCVCVCLFATNVELVCHSLSRKKNKKKKQSNDGRMTATGVPRMIYLFLIYQNATTHCDDLLAKWTFTFHRMQNLSVDSSKINFFMFSSVKYLNCKMAFEIKSAADIHYPDNVFIIIMMRIESINTIHQPYNRFIWFHAVNKYVAYITTPHRCVYVSCTCQYSYTAKLTSGFIFHDNCWLLSFTLPHNCFPLILFARLLYT